MKRTTWIIVSLAIVLAGTCGHAAAQAGSPTLDVTVGFDGYCHSGDWCPVYVVVSNEGADIEGDLRVVVEGAGSRVAPSVYGRPVVMPTHSRKAYSFVLPPADSFSRYQPVVQLTAGGRSLASVPAAVTWLAEGDRLYGVTSSSPSSLNFLGDVTPAGGRAAVAHLDLEALPPDPLGWGGLDVLVVSDVDTTSLGGRQRQSLETWVAHGGHLVVGGGAGTARTVAGVADLLPVVVEGTRSVDDLRPLGEPWGATLALGPYAVAQVALRNGEALIERADEAGGLVLLARRTYGAGAVDFLAFDAGINPFSHWEDNLRLWESIVGASRVRNPRIAVHDGYAAYEAVRAIPGVELPSILQGLAFMLAYTLLIGPINYLVLRKLDRLELAWLTIPVLIVGFTVCAYATGFQVRGGTAILHRLAAVYVPPDASVGHVSEVVGLFSPRRTTYDVRIAGAGGRRMSGDSAGGSAAGATTRPLRFVVQAEGLTVTDLRVDVGGIQPFVVEGYTYVPPVDVDLRLVDGAPSEWPSRRYGASGLARVEGTLRNGEIPLRDVVLISGDQEQRLGDLGAGEEFDVSLQHSVNAGLLDVPERILGPGAYWSDRGLYRRYQFLQSLFPPGGSQGPLDGVYLVGWAEEVPLPADVVERPFSAVETVLYIYALPVGG